jgi:hypothetical protein
MPENSLSQELIYENYRYAAGNRSTSLAMTDFARMLGMNRDLMSTCFRFADALLFQIPGTAIWNAKKTHSILMSRIDWYGKG